MRGLSAIVLVLAAVVMGGCQAGDIEVVNGPQESHALGRSEVVETATSYLSKLEWGDDYLTGSPRVVEKSQEWYVYFKHVNAATRRPSEGLVVVQKASGVASWHPGR